MSRASAASQRQPAGGPADPSPAVLAKGAHQAQGFKLKRWAVHVAGYGAGIYLTPTRGKATAEAWRSDAFNHISFKDFLRIARCVRTEAPPTLGAPITISGKPAFFCGSNSQYVQFAWPGGDFVLNSHPMDVEPESYRPPAYRTAIGDRSAERQDRATGLGPQGESAGADRQSPNPPSTIQEQPPVPSPDYKSTWGSFAPDFPTQADERAVPSSGEAEAGR